MRTFSKQPKQAFYSPAVNNRMRSISPSPISPSTPPANLQVTINTYKFKPLEDLIGHGYCSQVFRATQTQLPHRLFAIKRIDLQYFSNLELVQAEISIHKRLNHPNIVKLIQAIRTPTYYYLVLEYCSNGTLQDHIRKKGKIGESHAAVIMEQVTAGYKYLLGEDILHRDLKPSNILREGRLWKICDFGFAMRTKFGFRGKANLGTPLYMAPEALKKTYYSVRTDIFALGVLLHQLVTGMTPWPSKTENQLLEKMANEVILPESIKNKKIREFISRTCQLSQQKRMSSEEFIAFEFREENSSLSFESESPLCSSGSSHGTNFRKTSLLSQESTTITSFSGNQAIKESLEIISLELLFAQHLHSCLRNMCSFLLQAETIQILMLSLYKILIRMLSNLSDRKVNHFDLKGWPSLQTCNYFVEMQSRAQGEMKAVELQCLDMMKHNDIKIIRMVNRKFPDLAHTAPLTERFYESLRLYALYLIREHNHELMQMQAEQQPEERDNAPTPLADKIQALQGLYQIYTYSEKRAKPKENIDIAGNPLQVVGDFRKSRLTNVDYLDLRRLISNLTA